MIFINSRLSCRISLSDSGGLPARSALLRLRLFGLPCTAEPPANPTAFDILATCRICRSGLRFDLWLSRKCPDRRSVDLSEELDLSASTFCRNLSICFNWKALFLLLDLGPPTSAFLMSSPFSTFFFFSRCL